MNRLCQSEIQNWIAEHDPVPVVGWGDPVVEALGHHPQSRYAETYWLGLLGPSALWAQRRLVGWLEDSPEGYPLALAPMARELGLGEGVGRSSPLVRTLARLVSFDMAAIRCGSFAVRRAMGPLAQRQVVRLPGHLAERHRVETQTSPAATPAEELNPLAPVVAMRREGQDRAGSVGEAGSRSPAEAVGRAEQSRPHRPAGHPSPPAPLRFPLRFPLSAETGGPTR